ncbi:MAG: phosphomethylpyrimidine synthase ThiC [Clostridiales Family XIII bacterium]|jgi:phosphomethylpyrimidine synthase|nr:phosphomethylpyrimidine synthase ThiC [Clostridiales Family XIII bacterium]
MEHTLKYLTQLEAARQGVITQEMETAARKEHMAPSELQALVAKGTAVIPANRRHLCLDHIGIGSALSTKINVNLGVSKDCNDYGMEMDKVRAAVGMGAHAIMDLSSHGDTRGFRRTLVRECPAAIGTVPVYDAVIHFRRPLDELSAEDFLAVVRAHAEDGVDFVTLHCGLTRKTISQLKAGKRLMNIVSRGGSLIFAWMSMTGEENPFYEHYDELLEICREHDVTVSLGDACRPGCIEDASDQCQMEELVRLGELTERAWERGVQVMVEGPGHMPLDQIAANVKLQQTICKGAPFYVLGPLVTDIAPGYDHITSAIGGAAAAAAGAAFLCYVTPAEHLALPDLEDMKEGIVAAKIAAHAGDIAKGIAGARDADRRMSEARRALDWDTQFALAIDGGKARSYREKAAPEEEGTCSMCGKFCAIRSMNKALAGEHVDII